MMRRSAANIAVCCWICLAASDAGGHQPTTQPSPDGTVGICLPSGWRKLDPSGGLLYACDESGRAFVWMYSETKEDCFDLPLSKYATWIARGCARQMEQAEIASVRDLEVGDWAAVQIDVSGVKDHVRWTYVVTAIEGDEAFHVVLLCARPSGLLTGLSALDKMLHSFQIATVQNIAPATAPAR